MDFFGFRIDFSGTAVRLCHAVFVAVGAFGIQTVLSVAVLGHDGFGNIGGQCLNRAVQSRFDSSFLSASLAISSIRAF
ncbi:hypothetical protein MM710_37290, partial [Klebsiella pneumoniae]|nr:hypothetical protein [Klebsiella pneumoniae]